MQVMIGIKEGKEILFDEKQRIINYTDTIKGVCNNYFYNYVFEEEGEEVTYDALNSKSFVEILQIICKKQEETIGELKNILGNEKKNDIANILLDYSLMISVLAKAISLVEKKNDVYIVLT